MAKTDLIPPVPQARRKPIVINAEINRVITRSYIPHTEQRTKNIINRILALDEDETIALLESVIHDFSHRHRYFREVLSQNFNNVAQHIPNVCELSEQQRLLIGSYFTAEYSVEAAALFNPSIVPIPNLATDPKNFCRFIMSFRGVGEGHISSIEFRSGYIDENNDIYFDPLSTHVRTPESDTDSSYDRELFQLKLQDIGANEKVTEWLLSDLADEFTFQELEKRISDHYSGNKGRELDKTEAFEKAMWLAR